MDSSAYILTLMIMHTQCLPNTMHTYIYIYIYIYVGSTHIHSISKFRLHMILTQLLGNKAGKLCWVNTKQPARGYH